MIYEIDNRAYYKEILLSAFSDFQHSAENVLDLTLKASKELTEIIDSLLDEEPRWELLNNEVHTASAEIIGAITKLYGLDAFNFRTHLEVETYRHDLFF